MQATLDDMFFDFHAHHFYDDPKAADEVEDYDFDPDDVARQIGHDTPGDWEDLK